MAGEFRVKKLANNAPRRLLGSGDPQPNSCHAERSRIVQSTTPRSRSTLPTTASQSLWGEHSLQQAQGRLCPPNAATPDAGTVTAMWGQPRLSSRAQLDRFCRVHHHPAGNSQPQQSTIVHSMRPARIAELLAPFLGTPADDQRLATNGTLYHDISTYIDILLRWNARINLTAIRDPEQIVTRHFVESLFAARHLFPRVYPVPSVASVLHDFDSSTDQRPATRTRLANLGSGAGFPGIPFKLWNPRIDLTLTESNHKKATFLREIVGTLT